MVIKKLETQAKEAGHEQNWSDLEKLLIIA